MVKNCTTCRHAVWQTDTRGRRRFDVKGVCTYPVSPLPHSYVDYCGVMPIRSGIYKSTKADCPCWEKIGRKEE